MAISRQSDSIWAEAAMGEGRQDRAHSETRERAEGSAHSYGHALGTQHAHEAWETEFRDDHGRFAPTPGHDREKHEAEGKLARGAQRDNFRKGYHQGFTSSISKKEQENRHKKKESMLHRAVKQDPYTGELDFGDDLGSIDQKFLTDKEKQDRFRYRLEHGTYDGWTRHKQPEDNHEMRPGVSITDRNPAAVELDGLKHYANDVHGIPLTDKHPFSSYSYAALTGANPNKKSKARGKLPKGSLASEPMETVDANGVKHTFWHQVSTEFPVPNPDGGVTYQTEYPGAKMAPNVSPRVTVALHHHRSDTGLQPPMVSNHTINDGSSSTSRSDDLNGMFRTNDQTRLLHGLGFQRIGDWNDEIKFRRDDPSGQSWSEVHRVNGDDSRYPKGGRYYDPDLEPSHPDYVGEKWVVTPHTRERIHPFDPRSGTRGVEHTPIEFRADDDHGFNNMIQHIVGGKPNELAHPYTKMPQNHMPNDGGLPPANFNPKTGSVRPWRPEYNVHRSQERLGLGGF